MKGKETSEWFMDEISRIIVKKDPKQILQSGSKVIANKIFKLYAETLFEWNSKRITEKIFKELFFLRITFEILHFVLKVKYTTIVCHFNR